MEQQMRPDPTFSDKACEAVITQTCGEDSESQVHICARSKGHENNEMAARPEFHLCICGYKWTVKAGQEEENLRRALGIDV